MAHLCRCTGWQSIVEAAAVALGLDGAPRPQPGGTARPAAGRVAGPDRRSGLPDSGPDVVLGGGGFADDAAPPRRAREWRGRRRPHPACAPARAGYGRSRAATAPCPCRTRSRCPRASGPSPCRRLGRAGLRRARRQLVPGPAASPPRPLANGGAFGGKRRSPGARARRELADRRGGGPGAVAPHEDVVRLWPQAPAPRDATGPTAPAGPSGVRRVRPTWHHLAADTCRGACPAWGRRSEWRLPGPAGGRGLRGRGGPRRGRGPRAQRRGGRGGPGRAHVGVPGAGSRARVELRRRGCARPGGGRRLGRRDPLPVTFRSYALGAVHQALGMVWSEGIAVNERRAGPST